MQGLSQGVARLIVDTRSLRTSSSHNGCSAVFCDALLPEELDRARLSHPTSVLDLTDALVAELEQFPAEKNSPNLVESLPTTVSGELL